MQYKTFRETLQDIIEGKKADLVAAIKNRESKVKDPDNDVRLAGMRTRLSKMPDDVAKAVRGDTDTPIKKSMRANRPKGAESDEAFQARLAANTKKLPPEEEKDNRSEREIEADKNAKRRATLTAAEREAEDDADAAERSREEDESQRNRDKTQKDDDERDENRRREDLSPEDRKAEDENRAAVSKKNKERKDRYDKLTPKQKGAYNDRGGFKDDPWALGPDSVSDENKDPLDETTRQYKTFRETLQDIVESTNRRSDLQEANELNEELMEIIEALCEHFDLDTQMVLENFVMEKRESPEEREERRERDAVKYHDVRTAAAKRHFAKIEAEYAADAAKKAAIQAKIDRQHKKGEKAGTTNPHRDQQPELGGIRGVGHGDEGMRRVGVQSLKGKDEYFAKIFDTILRNN